MWGGGVVTEVREIQEGLPESSSKGHGKPLAGFVQKGGLT